MPCLQRAHNSGNISKRRDRVHGAKCYVEGAIGALGKPDRHALVQGLGKVSQERDGGGNDE